MVIYEYRMPELGEGLHEGEIVKWRVRPGDSVREDDILLEVQNDKAVVEVPSPVSGVVKELKAAEGATAVVGDVLAVIDAEGEAPAAPAAQSGDGAGAIVGGGAAIGEAPPSAAAGGEAAAGAGVSAAAPPSAPQAAGAAPGAVLATPAGRKLAREKGVDLAKVTPTGRNGRITREDVLGFAAGGAVPAGAAPAKAVPDEAAPRAAAAGAPTAAQEPAAAHAAAAAPAAGAHTPAGAAPAAEERVPLRGIRKVIAQAMVKSMYTAPHVTVMDEADVTALVALRERLKPHAEERGAKLTYLPFVVKALIAAAREFPILNAALDEEAGEIVYKKAYHVGIATDTENGLVVPVVFDADRKSLLQIAGEIRGLAARAREGKLAPHEMRGSTITVTNIGSAGGLFFTPIINYPEVAILGTGRITEKPVVRNGEIAVGQTMALSLSFDHRVIDGAAAQQALNRIKRLLAEPELMILEV